MPDAPAADSDLKAAQRAAGKLLRALGTKKVVVVDDDAVPKADVFIAAYSGNQDRVAELLPGDVAWEELEPSDWVEEVRSAFEGQCTAMQRRELHDRALWMPLAKELRGVGSTTALVGSYETVAAALIDYTEIGCDLLSIRGWDPYNDAVDYARHVLPLVRQELVHRESTGNAPVLNPDSRPAVALA